MKQTFALVLLLTALFFDAQLYAQKKPPTAKTTKDTVGYYVNSNNQKIYMFGKFELTTETINYNTIAGKLIDQPISKVKWAKAEGRTYLAYPRKENAAYKDLMEMAAYTDKYILMRSYESYFGIYYNNYYIYDLSGKAVVEDTYDYGKEANLADTMKKYMGSCQEFMKSMNDNLKHQKGPVANIHNLDCAGPQVLEGLIANIEKEDWKEK